MTKPSLVTPAQIAAVLATDPQTQLRSEFALTRQARPDGPDRTISFVCSTEGTKRDGHRILTAGWALDNYKRTGAPVLWCHDVTQPAIGIAPTMRVEGKQLVAEVTYAKPDDYAFADTVYRLYAADPPIMRAGSVQWMPLKWEPNLDEQGRQVGLTYVEQELLEFSLCPVPADPDAIMRAIQQRQVTAEEVERLVRRVTPGVSPIVVRLNDAASEDSASSPTAEGASPSTSPSLPAASSRSLPVGAEPPDTTPTLSSAPSPASEVSAAPPSVRGPLAEAMAADDEANLWDAVDQVERCHGTMLRMVYMLPPGAQDNSSQVDSFLRECGDMMRPLLLTIANNQAKRAIPASLITQRTARGVTPVVTPETTPEPPLAPVLSIQERLSALTAQKAADALTQRLSKLKHIVTVPPPPADVPEETTQQQLYFGRSAEAHASIAAQLQRIKQR